MMDAAPNSSAGVPLGFPELWESLARAPMKKKTTNCRKMPNFLDELSRRTHIYNVIDASLMFDEGEHIGYDLTSKTPVKLDAPNAVPFGVVELFAPPEDDKLGLVIVHTDDSFDRNYVQTGVAE